ncbi:MAG TPA: hypothetical protein VM943_08860, partial [Pyrinomonadaceae bacterium]|nr:hypothetical protein [Pyrinomonadaceae bacterium]
VLFGGEVLRGFSLALFVGIIVGTYSTIAIASPIMVWLQKRLDPSRSQPSPTNAPGARRQTTSSSTRREKAGAVAAR